MSTLSRFFHFHEGTPRERAIKVGGVFLATLAIAVTAGAVQHVAAQNADVCTLTIENTRVEARADGATVRWSTNCSSKGGIFWGRSRDAVTELALEPDYDRHAYHAGEHTVTLTGLQPTTAYYYAIDAANGPGVANRARSAVGTFTTAAADAAPAAPAAPAAATLSGCPSSQLPPVSAQLRPGIAGQDTLCVKIGPLTHRVRLVSHAIRRSEYASSRFEVTIDPCPTLSRSIGPVDLRPGEPVVDGVRIRFSPPSPVQADTAMQVTLEDARRTLALDASQELWTDDPLAYVPASDDRPEVYVQYLADGRGRTNRSRGIVRKPQFTACAVTADARLIAAGEPVIAGSLPTTLLSGIPLHLSVNSSGSASRNGRTLSRTQFTLRSSLAPVSGDLELSAIHRRVRGGARYDAAVCNVGYAHVTGDVAVRGTFTNLQGAEANATFATITGGIAARSCRTADLTDPGNHRLPVRVTASASANGLSEPSTANNALTVDIN